MKKQLRILGAILISATVFTGDAFTSLHCALAVAYVVAILLIAPISATATIAAGAASTLLTFLAFEIRYTPHLDGGVITRLFISVVAIILATFLSLRDRMTRTSLVEQARILELSHDTVIIRDKNDTIVYWNDGAEDLYGWSRVEAIGMNCGGLLRCSFPADEVDASLNKDGHWSGHVARERRDGASLILASRWLRRKDAEGRSIGVIESSADVTAQLRYDTERRFSEQRYQTIFEAAGFATWESDWSDCKKVLDYHSHELSRVEDRLLANFDMTLDVMRRAVVRNANPAAEELFQAKSKDALVGSNLCARYLADSYQGIAHILATLHNGKREAESEVRLTTLKGRVIDVVLRATIPLDSQDWSHVLVMAFDLTQRNHCRDRIDQTSAELAHAARVSLLGQLSASIAHEVNQPLTAIINYARSGAIWLAHEQPDLIEVSSCLSRIATSGHRAAEVIKRVKCLASKHTTPAESFDLIEVVDEAFILVQSEARSKGVKLRQFRQTDIPFAYADRVQIQQVLVNLIMNGLQAMAGIGNREKELCVYLGEAPDGMLQVEVKDAGVGFAEQNIERVFEPFFTTKSDGMGMGLSICRSIVEAQGGRISVLNNDGPGATVTFLVPPG